MQLEGRIKKDAMLLALRTVELPERGGFAKRLDVALLELCKSLQIPLPIWLAKNTREFARFHQTIFFPEQFAETVIFDDFQIVLMEDQNVRAQ